MKKTLLQIVQSVLNAMESDPVNTISDTEESLEVVMHARECFEELLSQRDWPFLRTKYSLNSMVDVTNPTTMRLPEGAGKIFWLKYNGKDVCYIEPKKFQDMLDQRIGAVNMDSAGLGTASDPSYYTTFDDDHIVMDSRDSDVDAVLQESKSVVYGTVYPEWIDDNDFVPALPAKMFPMYLAEVKSTCFLNIKQQANAKEERKSTRGRMTMQNEAWRENAAETKNNTGINYGRK